MNKQSGIAIPDQPVCNVVEELNNIIRMLFSKTENKAIRVYTSYFDNLHNIPKHIVPISIAENAPDWYQGLVYCKLSPNYVSWITRKNCVDDEVFAFMYNNIVLNRLNKEKVLNDIYKKSHGHDIVLLCHEKPDEFCHRHLVATWLSEITKVNEWFY